MNRKPAIDWQQVRLRLERGEAAVELGGEAIVTI